MKKIIFFAMFIAFNYANAQTSSDAVTLNTIKPEKKNAYRHSANVEPTNEEVDSKVMKHFSTYYPNADNSQWTVYNDKSSVCRFYVSEKLHRAYYNHKARWSGTITTYHPLLLPKNIKNMAETMFPEYKIKLVNEIKIPDHAPVYVLHAQSLKYLKILRATEDEGIDVMENFENSD